MFVVWCCCWCCVCEIVVFFFWIFVGLVFEFVVVEVDVLGCCFVIFIWRWCCFFVLLLRWCEWLIIGIFFIFCFGVIWFKILFMWMKKLFWKFLWILFRIWMVVMFIRFFVVVFFFCFKNSLFKFSSIISIISNRVILIFLNDILFIFVGNMYNFIFFV